MKINKRDPKHWGTLILSGVYIVAASLLRPFITKGDKIEVVLYGHTLNGNLYAFAQWCRKHRKNGVNLYYATLDLNYYDDLKRSGLGVTPLNLLSFRDVLKIARSDTIIADRKPHTLIFFAKLSGLKFVDVWHGIPYKGFSPEMMSFLKDYDEVWVSSPGLVDLYVDTFKVPDNLVFPTGYSRVDPLAANSFSAKKLRQKYDIGEGYRKVVLVAPTWEQDEKGRSIMPFGTTEDTFFSRLNKLGQETNTLFIFRAHINVSGAANFKSLPYVRNMPYALYPLAEEFLAISDVLVTDWSSMAFDFLVLKRPTIFLDVKAPFKEGFALGPEYRFGDVVGSMDSLFKALETYIKNPVTFTKKFGSKMREVEQHVYGSSLDGKSAERCYDRLERLVGRQ